MIINGDLKNIFQPAGGVKILSLLHSEMFTYIFRHENAQKMPKNAPKRAKVSVSERTYPVSIYILDFYCIGWLGVSQKVKIVEYATFTSEGQPSLFWSIVCFSNLLVIFLLGIAFLAGVFMKDR
jgi:hypothetical protein